MNRRFPAKSTGFTIIAPGRGRIKATRYAGDAKASALTRRPPSAEQNYGRGEDMAFNRTKT